jgi:probable F420-dependent oxidoreductase
MHVGVALPEQSIGFDPAIVRDFACLAEELGFAYITCLDHVLGTVREGRDPPFPAEGPYTEKHVFHEPLTLFGFLAAVTRRIELVTAVLVLPQRPTVLVAKQAAEVALLSNYRLRLGVGSGWNWVEYESLGEEFRTRGRRLEEQVGLLRALWSGEVLDYRGEFHRVDRASINPPLTTRVPIWFGGFSQIQQDRCARIGDGMLWSRDSSLARRGNDQIRMAAAALGRDPSGLGFQATVTPDPDGDLDGALARWSKAGGTHATVAPERTKSGSELVQSLSQLRKQVGDWIR